MEIQTNNEMQPIIKKTSDLKQYMKQYNKSYYEINKKRIIDNLNQKIECENCKRCVSKTNLLKHKKTQLCKRWNKKPETNNVQNYYRDIGFAKKIMEKYSMTKLELN